LKKFVQNILISTTFILSASTVFAQYGTRSSNYSGSSSYSSSVSFGTENELITNGTFGKILTGKACKNCDSRTDTNISATYLRTINANIQGGVLANINSTSGGTSETLLTLVALGIYNFDTSFKQAFFAQGGLGIYPVAKDNAPGYESKFGFLIGGGKRFPIWGNVNYIPTVSLVKKGDLDFGFDIEFLNFSLMF
jgi:hypothetical protein